MACSNGRRTFVQRTCHKDSRGGRHRLGECTAAASAVSPPGRWQVRIRDKATKRIVSLGTFPTKTDANAALTGADADNQRGGFVAPKGAPVHHRSGKRQVSELATGGDAQLAEDATQVSFDRARAQEQLRADLSGGGSSGDQSGNVQLMGGEGIGHLGGSLARVFTSGAQLAGGPLGEGFRTHVREQLVRDSELFACVLTPAFAAQPLAVDEVCTREVRVHPTAAEPLDRLEAKRAQLTEGAWVLTDAVRYRAGQARESIGRIQVPTGLSAQFLDESLVPPDSISIFQLPAKIAAARSYGVSADGYAMQFHRLIALPALFSAMTLIAAMVSLRFVRFGQSMTVILGGILAGFVLYVVSEVIQAFGEAGTLPPIVAAWLPVVVAASLGTTVLLHKEDG